MLRKADFTLLILTIVAIFAFTSNTDAGFMNAKDWAKPGDNVEAGEITIKITRDIAPLRIEIYDGIVMTGVPSLDAAADAFAVYNIRKTYMMKTTPLDPSEPDLSRYYQVYFPESYGPNALLDAYEACPEVEFAEFVPIMLPCYTPNDPRFRNQWHLEHCRLPDAWNITHGSREVVVGIIDSGLDMNIDGFFTIHEDFRNNIWINYGEDIDGDSAITLDDWNGEDDDENGFADDFHGWNFSHYGEWPDDYWGVQGGHGTHVAGIVSADTDNETGIAGNGFNCKLMITAHYDTRDPEGGLPRTYEGIEYCARNGADVMNLSWGRLSAFFRSNQDVIDWAIGQGSIIFAGCGNDDTFDDERNREHFYPCAYDGVIGVGAIEQHDLKADFSNWGDFTDLVTPGVGILSAWPRNDYDVAQGTSMSSPFAAGVCALLLSVEPDLNVGQALEWMQRTAVDISDLNEDYPGIQYRVDAGYLLESTRPKYELLSWETVEIEGDQDGILERGEVIGIPLTLANLEGYADGTNITLRLESDDEYIHIQRSPVEIGDIGAGEEYEVWEDESPTFFVRWISPIHYTTLRLVVSSNDDWEVSYELPMTILKPLYLLVDDDGGEGFETPYISDLGQRPIVHDTWSIYGNGQIGQEYLNSYNFVVWETGNAEQPLTEAEQSLIANYLDNDGYLLLSGQYIGDDIGATDFHRNYLKAEHVAGNTGSRRVQGIEGNLITNGMDLLLFGAGSAGNGTLSPSAMTPLGGAQAILNYDGDEYTAGIYYAGDYHLVYTGFAIEAVNEGGRTTSRRELIEKILDYFYELGVDEDLEALQPSTYGLDLPQPNPFNALTSVQVSAPQGANFVLEVIDLTGRQVAVLHEGASASGRHIYRWNAVEMPAGVYLLNLRWTDGSLTRKVVLVK